MISMFVEKEENNKLDPWPMVVSMPKIVDIDRALQNEITRESEKNRPMQSVSDKAGLVIRRVQANFCRALCLLKSANMIVGEISCYYTGEAGVSKNLPVHQSFKRNKRPYFNTQGGGAELKCTYVFKIRRSEYERAKDIIEANVPVNDL